MPPQRAPTRLIDNMNTRWCTMFTPSQNGKEYTECDTGQHLQSFLRI